MEVNIRRAVEEDFPAILKLIKELAEYERSPEAVTNTVEQMRREQNHFRCFVADNAEDGIMGMALYFFAYFTWGGNRSTSRISLSASSSVTGK